jgi:hypothetical protein
MPFDPYAITDSVITKRTPRLPVYAGKVRAKPVNVCR